MNPYSVIKRPHLSEKSADMLRTNGQYAFFVEKKATKHDVKQAVEKLFDVNVLKVTTAITRGKHKRRGAQYFLSDSQKRAVVTLSEGQTIPIFEELK
jgi:large subunit ribosomal protein L23